MRLLLFLILISFISCSNQKDNYEYTTDDAREKFLNAYPNLSIDSIERINNAFFEILIGEQIFYISTDLEYLLAGNIINLDSGKNITQDRIKKYRLAILNTIDDKDTIVYSGKKIDHSLIIFTDTTCPYCQKLHNEINSLITNNIQVKYVLFSRNGPEDDAYQEMVSIWCSDDKKKSIKTAFSGNFVEQANCKNPLDKNQALAYKLRVNGTPMIFTESGDVIPGYVPYKKIIEILDKN